MNFQSISYNPVALPLCIIPTIIPNNPKALPNISIIKILTNVSGVWASEIAQPDPVTPTQILNKYLFTHKINLKDQLIILRKINYMH
jgi:hypothetical protein